MSQSQTKNKLICKKLYRVDVVLQSPLSVSSGENDMTDSDVLRDGDGSAFVSGATLAGACREYLGQERNKPGLFGSSAADGKMSQVSISDLVFFDNPVKIVSRDGVGLTEDKQTDPGAKFDLEAIDTGAKGYFVLEVIIRDSDDEEAIDKKIYRMIGGIQRGEVRLGSKKTRGYGQMEVFSVLSARFDASNIEKYGIVYEALSKLDEDKITDEQKHEVTNSGIKFVRISEQVRMVAADVNAKEKYVHIRVPLKNTGCISIRQYQAKVGEPDFIHIHANDKPVIPGTSFAGAIRSRTLQILKEATKKPEYAKRDVDELFGYVKKNTHDAQRSRIWFGESILSGADRSELTITRSAISRFESATHQKALYKETTCVGGEFDLNIWVEKQIADQAIPLLMPALLDLQRGYLPIGGMVSIGRGILAGNGDVSISPMIESASVPQMSKTENVENWEIAQYRLNMASGKEGVNV